MKGERVAVKVLTERMATHVRRGRYFRRHGLTCYLCKKPLQVGEKVVVKRNYANITKYYHVECARKILLIE